MLNGTGRKENQEYLRLIWNNETPFKIYWAFPLDLFAYKHVDEYHLRINSGKFLISVKDFNSLLMNKPGLFKTHPDLSYDDKKQIVTFGDEQLYIEEIVTGNFIITHQILPASEPYYDDDK